MGRLKGKSAVVTGAGGVSGGMSIGKAIALRFAQEGARVAVMDLDPEKAEHTRHAIEQAGGEAITVEGDVSDDRACQAAVDQVRRRFGGIHVLVNNVGISRKGDLDAFDEAIWSHVMDVNLKGAVLMVRHCLPQMASARGGSIVNIASIAGLISSGGGHFAYGPSKAALLGLTRDIAVRYGRDGVRANALVVGHVHTPMVNRNSGGKLDPTVRERRRKVAPLGIEGDGQDVANAALFLASDEARFITGVSLPVDGGVSIISPIKALEFMAE